MNHKNEIAKLARKIYNTLVERNITSASAISFYLHAPWLLYNRGLTDDVLTYDFYTDTRYVYSIKRVIREIHYPHEAMLDLADKIRSPEVIVDSISYNRSSFTVSYRLRPAMRSRTVTIKV